ncbi:MAG TPA: adenylosuccinate lyase, partial [Polyangiaceae bacterium]|nr:adenylosuccinate lyase [Polyangiaceae bacterium]
RMIAPDVTTTLAFMLDRATQLIEGLVVYPEQMNRNVQRSAGLCFSESVLLALVDRGIARQQAYVMVQRNAMKAIEGHGSLLENLLSDEQVVERIGREPLIRCFDLEHSLRHVDEILARAFE